MKRQRTKPGDILKVPIGDGTFTYARILITFTAFYDCRTTEDISDLEKIISSPILFKIAVDRHVETCGVWPKVGFLPLEEHLQKDPDTYIKEIGFDDKYTIINGFDMRPATREECIGLEVCASWEQWHVEERLQSHYLGTYSRQAELYGPLKA